MTVKTFVMLQKFSASNKSFSFDKIHKICPNKLSNNTRVFIIDNNKKCFLRSKSVYFRFLKDHVALKTEVMMLKIQHYGNKLHSILQKKTAKLVFHNITVFIVL